MYTPASYSAFQKSTACQSSPIRIGMTAVTGSDSTTRKPRSLSPSRRYCALPRSFANSGGPSPELLARLLDNAAYLERGLTERGFEVVPAGAGPDGAPIVTPIVPVMVGDDWDAVLLWKALYDAGVYTNVALYPAVQRGGALIRTSVMATHEREHLDHALEIFEQVRDSAQAGDAS